MVQPTCGAVRGTNEGCSRTIPYTKTGDRPATPAAPAAVFYHP